VPLTFLESTGNFVSYIQIRSMPPRAAQQGIPAPLEAIMQLVQSLQHQISGGDNQQTPQLTGPLPPGLCSGPSSRAASLVVEEEDPNPPPLPASDNSVAEPDDMEVNGGTPGSVTPAPPTEPFGETFLPEGVTHDTPTGVGWGAPQCSHHAGAYQDPPIHQRSPQQRRNGDPAAQQAGQTNQEYQPEAAITSPPQPSQAIVWSPGRNFLTSPQGQSSDPKAGPPLSGSVALGVEGTFPSQSAAGGGWAQALHLQSRVGEQGQPLQQNGGQVRPD
jgi:hypothetical protein